MDNSMGYSYFGFRYLDTDLSVWLSVDPQAVKYPALSPYMYVAGNPLKFTDPNGDTIYLKGNQKRIDRFIAVLNTASAATGSTAKYSYDDKNRLQVTGVTKGDYFAEKMDEYTRDTKVITHKISNGWAFIDEFESGRVDVKDLERLGNPYVQQAAILHLTAERMAFDGSDDQKWLANRTQRDECNAAGREAQSEFFNSVFSGVYGLDATLSKENDSYMYNSYKTKHDRGKAITQYFGNVTLNVYHSRFFQRIKGSDISFYNLQQILDGGHL